ncbi:hypothetical protein [Pseudoxanthomonas sp. Root630]|uniref:hypothetical protein n=1 Tax=Pseudoxanthomonas sp. Root630 TaxID=1736574 RepID=UPI0012DEE86A|nr:hypothetical protein [Pseudoxanthomonas sp. Root630]
MRRLLQPGDSRQPPVIAPALQAHPAPRANQRSVIDIGTVRTVNDTLIRTAEEVRGIHREGVAKRKPGPVDGNAPRHITLPPISSTQALSGHSLRAASVLPPG